MAFVSPTIDTYRQRHMYAYFALFPPRSLALSLSLSLSLSLFTSLYAGHIHAHTFTYIHIHTYIHTYIHQSRKPVLKKASCNALSSKQKPPGIGLEGNPG